MIENFSAELQAEAVTTRTILAAVPAEHFGWKPHTKSLSAGELAAHIADIPAALFDVTARDSFDVSNFAVPFAAPASSDALLARFDRSVEAALSGLRAMAPERLSEPWRIVKDGKAISELPRHMAMRNLMFNHLYHHRGQLSVYLRLLDVPVPSVYGPTADANPLR